MALSTGGEFALRTVIWIERRSARGCRKSSSTTQMSNPWVCPPCNSDGVHVKTPVTGSIKAPETPAIENLSVSPSGSVAAAVKLYVSPSLMVVEDGTVSTGALLVDGPGDQTILPGFCPSHRSVLPRNSPFALQRWKALTTI